jgi:hypothetical protein
VSFEKTGNFGVRGSFNVPVDGVTGGAGEATAPSFGPPSCSLLDSPESFRPRLLPRFFTRLNRDIASTSTFGGNNGCIRNSSDDGEVKSTPTLPSGYCGQLVRLGCQWNFTRNCGGAIGWGAGDTTENFLCFERTVTDTTRGDLLVSSATSTSLRETSS